MLTKIKKKNYNKRIFRSRFNLHQKIYLTKDKKKRFFFKKKRLSFLFSLKNYRSLRLKKHYPARGQRTKTNGRTCKKIR